jgi:opacity protein-like surface antigen
MLDIFTGKRSTMKLISAVLLAAIVIMTGQHEAQGQLFGAIDVGGKTGLNVATHVGPDADGVVVKSTNKLAFSIGGVASYSVHRTLAVQMELLFSTKGRNDIAGGMAHGGVDMYYIDLPLLAKFEIPLGIRVKPYLLMGSGFGILLHAVGENTDGTRVDITKRNSTLDIGPVLGAGGAYYLNSRGVILFEVRYFRGLTTLDASSEFDYYNRTFTFMLGYQCCASSGRRGSGD